MPPLAVAFLGVIALAAVVQCALVIVVALSVRDTGARVTDLCRRFDSELRPALNDLRLGAANLRAVSETARDQAARAASTSTALISAWGAWLLWRASSPDGSWWSGIPHSLPGRTSSWPGAYPWPRVAWWDC